MIAISGNTFPVKDQLKSLGGRWDAARKCWMIPDQNAEQARTLVAPKPPAPAQSFLYCRSCGQTGRRGAYPFSTLPGSGRCDDCV